MEISDSGLAFIEAQEGCVLRVYKDQAGLETIGVGHRLKPGESFPNGITEEQARALLRQDVAVAEADVNAHVKVAIGQNAFDSLVSFTYNVGGGAFASSTLLVCLNAGETALAANHLLDWDKIDVDGEKVVSADLVKRRKAERALFLTPDAPDAPDAAPTVPDLPGNRGDDA